MHENRETVSKPDSGQKRADFKNRVTISVVINTKNEEANMERCLKNVTWADEIIVMDMNSTDQTVAMARKFNANIYSCPDFQYVEPARNMAIEKATGDWVFVLDADEEICEQLAADIQKIIGESDECVCIYVPRQNHVGDYVIHDCGWGEDSQPRLFKRGKVRWLDDIHSHPVIDGKTRKLRFADGYYMRHYGFKDFGHFVTKINLYTAFEANQLVRKGAKFDLKDILQITLKEFTRRYTPQEDGIHGFLVAGCMAFYRFLSYGKALEKIHNENKDFKLDAPGDLVSSIREETAEVRELVDILNGFDEAVDRLYKSSRWKWANPLAILKGLFTRSKSPVRGYGRIDDMRDAYRIWLEKHPGLDPGRRENKKE